MSNQTEFLNLILPENGEYTDTWDEPLNENLQKIDDWAKAQNEEITEARFDKGTLKEFLEAGHESDGTLKSIPEVAHARSSFLYGDEQGAGNDFTLKNRNDMADRELYSARMGYDSLRAAMASNSYIQNAILTGTKDVNGYPTWLGFTGANAIIDGSEEPIFMMINGKVCRVRDQKQVAATGSSGTKYLYAQFSEEGSTIVDGDSSTAPPENASGTIGNDGFKVRLFEDLAQNFTNAKVQPNDILEILGTNENNGMYLVNLSNFGGNPNRLQIKGVFRSPASGLNYTIRDPMGVTLGFDDAKVPAEGKFYIGEAEYDGASITAVRAIHFKDVFISEWRSVDVSVAPLFTEVFNHNLFDDVLDISVQASQSNDGSQPVECLSLGGMENSLSIQTDNGTLELNEGTFNPGTSGATYNPMPSLNGSVSSTLNGHVRLTRSVLGEFTSKRLTLKNVSPNLFYRDFGGTDRATGYIRVIITKKRT